MGLIRLLKLLIPEINVCRRKTGTWSVKTQSFVKKTLRQVIFNYGIKVHVNDQGRNMAIHDVIARLCYCHRVELSMHFFGRIG